MLLAVRCFGAVGFLGLRWLQAVCNVPALCDWLALSSGLLAALSVMSYVGPWGRIRRAAVLGRHGARLLVLTAALNLAVGVAGAVWVAFPGMAWFIGVLDFVAWGWVLFGVLAVARWRARGHRRAAPALAGYPARRHTAITVLIILALGLQVAALFRDRPTLWPFIDYPLYSSAHGTPIRAQHYRLYGLTADDPPVFVEISAESLGMSWFVHHTQFIPRIFAGQTDAIEDLGTALRDSALPRFRGALAEHTVFILDDGELREFPERRWVTSVADSGDAETVNP